MKTTENRLTPQMLALYLGTECQYIDEDKNELILPLLAVNLSGYAWFVDPEYDEAIPIKDVKPILRPLSSMTEEETKELNWRPKYFDGGAFPKPLTFLPNEFAYLLSKSFDLFGLIDNNLAVNKI